LRTQLLIVVAPYTEFHPAPNPFCILHSPESIIGAGG
jgi:hypothetical protein